MEGGGCRVHGEGCRVQGAGCRVQGAGCWVQGAGCRVQGAGCRVQGVERASECSTGPPPDERWRAESTAGTCKSSALYKLV